MTKFKSKHITLPSETHDRTTRLCERLGCSFSKLVQIALKERLSKWEREAGSFQLDEKTLEQHIMERLERNKGMQPLRELL